MTGEPTRSRPGGWLWAGLSPSVKILVAARFVNRLGAFSMPFLAVLLVLDHGASPGLAGTIVGAFGLATIPSRLLGGQLVGAAGTKIAVVTGLLGTAVAQLLIATAPNLPAALGAAVLLGLCFEIYEPASQGLIADVTPDDLLPTAYGLLGATLAAAALAAGLVASAVGKIGLSWLFVVDAATALACAALVMIALPATPRPSTSERVRARPWTDRHLLCLMGTGTAFAVVYMTIPMAMPIALSALGRGPAEAGLLESLGALTIIAAQPLLRGAHGSAERRMLTGYLLMAAGLAVAGAVPSLGGYVMATVLIAVGDLFLLGYAYTLVAQLAPPGAKAAYFSVYGLTWGIALTVGPPIMGLAITASPRTFWLSAAVAMLITGSVQRLISSSANPPGFMPSSGVP